jgi:hypothetical protein
MEQKYVLVVEDVSPSFYRSPLAREFETNVWVGQTLPVTGFRPEMETKRNTFRDSGLTCRLEKADLTFWEQVHFNFLSEEDWEELVRRVKEHGLVVSIGNYNFGFKVCINIYEEGPVLFPGVTPELTHLASVDGAQIAPHKTWRDAWSKMSGLADTEKNREALKRCGFPPLRDITDYEY